MHPKDDSFSVHVSDLTAMGRLAAVVAAALEDGDLVLLAGGLGAGKTTFVGLLADALEVDEQVSSPTFALHHRYDGSMVVDHLDVYRLEQAEELVDLDLPSLLEDGVTLIEWGDRIRQGLGAEYLRLDIGFVDHVAAPEQRRVVVQHGGGWRAATLWADIKRALAGDPAWAVDGARR